MYIKLPYGNSFIQSEIKNLSLHSIRFFTLENQEYPSSEDDFFIKKALQNPIHSPGLREIASNRKNAVIIISDNTRLAPSQKFLPSIIAELSNAGISDENITIVVALGLHRHLTEPEIKELVGTEIKKRIRCLNHSPLQEDCFYVGTTSRGTPVEVFKPVVEADLRIVTGNIEPHKMAGFSGGIKAVIPGTAGEKTIKKNHALSKDVGARAGHIENNPVRLDLEEAASMVPTDFLLNVIVNPQRKILDAVAGHPIEAHRIGCQIAVKVFMQQQNQLYDIVIASAGGSPKDLNLYQAVKSLYNARQTVRQGGIIIFAARCQEGYGNGEFQRWIENITTPEKIKKKFAQKFVLGGHKANDLIEITSYAQVFMITDIPATIVRLMGMTPFSTLEEAVESSLSQMNRPEILVMPTASLSFIQT